MFVSFTKTLKKMSGFRLGFGVRVNKRNAPLWCFAMLFAGMFYLMWYRLSVRAGVCTSSCGRFTRFITIYSRELRSAVRSCINSLKEKPPRRRKRRSNRRRNEPNKKIPRARLESPHGGLFFMRRKAERGSAIRRTVNYSLLLSVSAGMPEMAK